MQTTLIDNQTGEILAPMTRQEARACVDAIKTSMQNLRLQIFELHERKGWVALGYDSWRECVVAEFPRQQSYLYYQLKAAQIEKQISTKVEIGQIPERQLRPLAKLEPDQQREAWEQAKATAPEGKVTGAHVQNVVDQMTGRASVASCPACGKLYDSETFKHCPYCYKAAHKLRGWVEGLPEKVNGDAPKRLDVHFSSETAEHYTPSIVIEAALDCLGEIDLDPCSNSHEQPNVPAEAHFTKEDDGLTQEWHGRVYMNPPYGREIGDWVEKLCLEHEAGRVTEAVALVPSRTDTKWWIRLRDYPVCFVEGRLSFGDSQNSAPFPSAIFYLGENLGAFYHSFVGLGDCWQRMMPGVSFGE